MSPLPLVMCLIAWSTPVLQTAQPVPAAVGTGIVRGTVVAGDTGEPVRRATVWLTNRTLTRPDGTGPRPLSTITDGEGRFAFTEVASGTITVSAMKDGYYHLSLARGDGSTEPQPPPRFDLAEGQTLEKLVITLARAGAIVGRVLDEFGDPASGVEIEILQRSGRGRGARWNSVGRHTQTDDTGTFRAWGLRPGDYRVASRPRVEVRAEPSRSGDHTGFARTYYPGTTSRAGAATVRVEAGQDTTGVVFGLLPTRLASIRGRVMLPEDLAVNRRIAVMVSQVEHDREDSGGTGSQAGADGVFEVVNLSPGRYRLVAREGLDGPWGKLRRAGVVEVDVDGTDVDGVVIALRDAVTVSGRVIADTGEPVAGRLRVQLAPDRRHAGDGFIEPATVGADGHFTLEHVVGRHVVRLVTTGPDARPLEMAPAQSQRSGDAPVRLAITAVRLGEMDVTDRAIDFSGRDEALTIHVTSRLTELTGAVQRSASAPGSGPRPIVIVFPDDEARWHEQSISVRAASVNPQGRFTMRGLPPGDHYLIVAVEGLRVGEHTDPEVLASLRTRATSVRLDSGVLREVALTAVPWP